MPPVDAKRIFGNVTQTVAANTLLMALGLVISIFAARVLGAQGRGEVAALVLFPQIFASIALLGLHTSFVYHAKKVPEALPGLLGWSLCIIVIASIPVAGVTWLLLPKLYVEQGAAWMSFVRTYVCVMLPISALVLFGSTAAQTFSDFRTYNISRLMPPAGQLLLMILVWCAGAFTSKWVALCCPYCCINFGRLSVSGALQGFQVMQQIVLDRRIGGHVEGQLALGPNQTAGTLDELAA